MSFVILCTILGYNLETFIVKFFVLSVEDLKSYLWCSLISKSTGFFNIVSACVSVWRGHMFGYCWGCAHVYASACVHICCCEYLTVGIFLDC